MRMWLWKAAGFPDEPVTLQEVNRRLKDYREAIAADLRAQAIAIQNAQLETLKTFGETMQREDLIKAYACSGKSPSECIRCADETLALLNK